jgi:hypothetical protein
MKKMVISFGLLSLLMAGSAFAGTTSKTLNVSVTVVDHCAIKSAVPQALSSSLGIPSTISRTDAFSTSAVNYTCTKGSAAPIIRLGQERNISSASTDIHLDVLTLSVEF